METRVSVKPGKLFIEGQWLESRSGKTFPTINPATGEAITTIQECTQEEVDQAATSARKALEEGPWGRMSASDRGKILWKIGELIRKHTEELAELETLDTGKPISESVYVDIPASAEVFYYYSGWATKIHGETIPVRGSFLNYTLREPVGVVAAIVPWNFPLVLATWKVAPALAAGNVVILKPSSKTPLTALRLAEIGQEAGLPDGVLNVITGRGETAGKWLASHPNIDKVAFTGDHRTGQEIMKMAAGNLKRISLELGGKSPCIIFSDADLEPAVRGSFMGIFYNKGEVCSAGSRLFVEGSLHDSVMEKLLERAKKMVPGDPLDPKTKLGPLTSEEQLEKVLGYVERGKKDGGELLCGGEKVPGKGYFMTPTIFDRVNSSMVIAREEIFGPVLSVLTFETLDDLLQQANSSIFGLAAGVWTRDIKKAHYVASKLKAGTIWINAYGAFDPASPFGGYKMSGFGRDLGMHALHEYTQVKSVWVDLSM